MIRILLREFWPSLLLLYYAAGWLLLAWHLTSKPAGYKPVPWRDLALLIGVAGALWVWPVLVVDRWLPRPTEPQWRRG